MPTAINHHITPTRRTAMRFSAAAIIAGLTTPVLAAVANPDADLIALCDQWVSIETERCLLCQHDEYAPDFGPNNVRYERLGNDMERVIDLVEECDSPTTSAGYAAVARAALTWVSRDYEGNITCTSSDAQLMAMLAEGVAAGFVWPPRPGSCSTAHWAPPTSPQEIAEHEAAHRARMAQIDAKIQAKKLAEAAERQRRDTPSLMTDEELRGQLRTSRRWVASINNFNAELSAEMARRGLEVA